MSDSRFEAALDSCIVEIIAGRSTVADCLADWPQFRDRLEPLLEAVTAIGAEPVVAERPPDPARRAEFMATIRSTPQQSPRPSLLRALQRVLAPPRLAMPAAVRHAGLVASAAAVFAIAALTATLVLGQGTSTAYASTVTVFAGTVEQQVDGRWVNVEDGARLSEGARLRTSEDGSAVLTFIDGSTAGIEANTELLIEFVVFGAVRQIRLQQFSGSLWNDVVTDESAGSFYTVRTPDAVISARGTLFETTVEDGETTIEAFDGLVEVEAGDESTFVTPGEFASARAHRQVAAAQARENAPQLALSVAAPFAASLVAPNGKATGVRQDGVLFNQIPGAATSHPSNGDQQLELSRLTPGTYRLLLSRTGEGGGEIVLQFGSERVTLPVSAGDNAVGVDLRVSVDADGWLRVEPANLRSVESREVERGGARVADAAERRATPPARRPDNAAGGGGDAPPAPGPQRGKSLQDQARDRLQQMLDDDSAGLGRRLPPDAKQKLRGHLDALDERDQERRRPDDEGGNSAPSRGNAGPGRPGNGANSDDEGSDRAPQPNGGASGRPTSRPTPSGAGDSRPGSDDSSDARPPQRDSGGPGRSQRPASRP